MAPNDNQLNAKTKMVTDYLLLAQAMHNAADSMNAYVAILAGTETHANTVSLLIPPPQLPPISPYNGQVNGYPRGQAPPAAQPAGPGAPRQQAPAQAPEEEGESKKRKIKEKKAKDPNAPKRPASGYLVYQNEMRPKLKEEHPEMAHKDLQAKISSDWASLDPDTKKHYTEQAAEALDAWKKETEAYKATDDYKAAHPDEKPKSDKPKKAPKAKATPAPAPAPVAAAESSGEDETDDDSDDAAAAVIPQKKKAASTDTSDSEEEEEEPAPKRAKKAVSPPKSVKKPTKAGRKSKA